MPVSVRQARHDDAADLTRLTLQLGYSRSLEEIRASLARVLARADERVLVAELDGVVAGCVHAVIADYLDVERYVHIAGLVVDAGARRGGVGRALMAWVEEWARQEGCGAVRLSSSSTRTAAHRFYERIGYANIKTQYSFAKAVDGASAESLRAFVPKVDDP
jgi:GNAT superfamily N-acetyltransferase